MVKPMVVRNCVTTPELPHLVVIGHRLRNWVLGQWRHANLLHIVTEIDLATGALFCPQCV